MESQILIVAVAGPHRLCRGGWRRWKRRTRREGRGARNENGRIEFPICDMRPRAARAVMRARRADANGGEGEGRGPDCAMVTRRGDGHGGRESAGRGLGYHFSAVLPRKHVPGINELTISEQLFPHRNERVSERATDRPAGRRCGDPFPPIYGGCGRSVRTSARKQNQGDIRRNETTFAVARGENTRCTRGDSQDRARARAR